MTVAAKAPLWPTKERDPRLGGPADPRPDLTDDGGRWRRVLTTAFLLDGDVPDGLYGALHGFRCLGARLVPNGSGKGCRLLAPIEGDGSLDYLEGDPQAWPAKQWAADREAFLLPHRDALTALLHGLGVVAG